MAHLPPLPPGWTRQVDAAQGAIYYAHSSGETTWDRPAADSDPPRQPPEAAAAFAASAAFAGSRPGCVFKKGDQGVGYYADRGPG